MRRDEGEAFGAGFEDVFGGLRHHQLEVLDEARGEGVILLEVLVAAGPGAGRIEDVRGHAFATGGDLKAEDGVFLILDIG